MDAPRAARRVKCGEERPHCRRCTSTGRKCDWYSQDNIIPSSVGLSLGCSPSLAINGTEMERRSFHYFLQKTAPQFCGSFGEDFWDILVLRAGHLEPAIKHAVISIGSMHERFVNNNGLIFKSRSSLYDDDFAIQQYNIAIKHLVKPKKEKQAIDVCLISCILFASLENMQGSYGSAISHVRSGTKILSEVRYDNTQCHHDYLNISTAPYVPIEALEAIFLRLELAITEIVGGYDYKFFENCAKARGLDNIPDSFTDLGEARRSLVFGWYMVSRGVQEIPGVDGPELLKQLSLWQDDSINVHKRWSHALETFIQSRGDRLTEKEKQAAAILNIQQHIGAITLYIHRVDGNVDDQTVFDDFNLLFEIIVDLCAQVLESVGAGPSFSLDMEVIGPLYTVAGCCRDPKIRRRAISLLQSSYRQEGVWNAFLTAKVAQRVMEIEEEGLGEINSSADIPDWARISRVDPQFDPLEKRGTITYGRMESKSGIMRKTVKEVIEW